MKRLRFWIPLALILVVNAVLLTGVAANRRGAADADLTLTQRELALKGPYLREGNGGMAVRLVWRHNFVDEWLTREKMIEIGFDPPAATDSARGKRPLPVKTFVVLEYKGESWERYKGQRKAELAELGRQQDRGQIGDEQADRRREGIRRDLETGSRLFAVDAGRSPQTLRSRYPDRSRHVIVPARARLYPDRGRIEAVLVDTLHLSRRLAAPLFELESRGTLWNRGTGGATGNLAGPRYEMRVRWGSRHEPWVVGVRLREDG